MKIIIVTLSAVLLTSAFLHSCANQPQNEAETAWSATPPSMETSSGDDPIMVTIPDNQSENLQIPLHTIDSMQAPVRVIAPGEVYSAPNYIAVISAPVEGRVLKMYANEGDPVSEGQVILEIESLTYGNLVATYMQAKAEEKYQESQLQRIRQLVDKGINPLSELEKVQADFTRATADSRAAIARLKAVGASDRDITLIEQQDNITPHLRITTPISGYVDAHMVELGTAVAVNQQLASVMNLNKVIVKSYVSPEDGRLVQSGDSIFITHRLIEHGPIEGIISSIKPGLDEKNRSVVLNAILENPNQRLKPGDIIRTEILTRVKRPVISIPLSAITYNNNDPVVFVMKDARHYEMRTITLEGMRGEKAYVTSGLAAGEKIAAGQIFSLKALARYELIAEE